MKDKYIILTPKNDVGKKKMDYHTDRWLYRGTVEKLKFTRDIGPFIVAMSLDGKKCLHIKEKDDPDFTYRML